MITKEDLSKIMFMDIETVPMVSDYNMLSERMKHFWDKKSNSFSRNEEDTPESLFGRAGIYSEFGKIVCISAGVISSGKLNIKSFYGDDEKALLSEFKESLIKFERISGARLCAHNGKEFDFPFICRRMVVHGMEIPEIINAQGKKPWEILNLDTLDMWKFGDYKNYTSLDLLCELFDIPTPKDDIDGSQVADVYYKENDLKRIAEYCQKDVVGLTQVFMRMNLLPLIQDVNIFFV